MPINCSAEELAIVRNILSSHVPDKQVVAFGSRITDTYKPFSDLDLAIFEESPTDATILFNLKHAFSESRLPFRIDVVDWASLDKGFQAIIASDHVEV